MIKSWIRSCLWKLFRRDCLVLNPAWAVVQRNDHYTLIGTSPSAGTRFLAVRYNYHTGRAWNLRYALRGAGAGSLRYQLGAPRKGDFCEVTLPVQLPCEWTVEWDGKSLMANGHPLPLIPGKVIPRDTPWLVGRFEFKDADGELWTRRTGHRVQSGPGEDADYFTGLVYDNYEAQAALFPRQILDLLRRYRPLTGRLLDVGCATGLLVEEAGRAGLEADGIDVSAWAVERANARAPGRCRVLNLDEVTVAEIPRRYDFITLHSVIEHLADPARALALLFQMSRPGGLVYVQTLNADSLMHRLLGQDWGGYTDYTHQSPWLTADWLDEQSRQAGFEVLHLKRYGIWNDNGSDDVWKSFTSLLQLQPGATVLEDQFGDFVELVLRRPGEPGAEESREAGHDRP